MAYATLLQLRAVLASSGNDLATTDDALLSMYLEDAQQVIDDYCNRTFEAASPATRTFDAVQDVMAINDEGGTGRTLWLRGYDLAEAPSAVVNGDGLTVSASEYVLEPRNTTPIHALTLKSGSSVAWTYTTSPENAIAVTGYWAYSRQADALIRGATLALAAWMYRQRNSSGDTDRPLLTGDGVTILPSALPKNVFERLSARRALL